MAFDLAADTVEIALTPYDVHPDEMTVWHAAEWTDPPATSQPAVLSRLSRSYVWWEITGESDGDTDTRWVRLLVGPGSPVGPLTAGTWACYARVTDNPERPVMAAGVIPVA